jgi:hypothetical protein
MSISRSYHYNTKLFISRKIQMRCQLFPFFGVLSALAFAPALTSVHAAGETAMDTATIEAITGLKGVSNQAEGTFKISKPRNDVPLIVDQVRMAPFMGLTSWATFAPGMQDRVMVMGDMVLFEDEVNPVMSVALDKGLEVTALHNHFFFDEPKVYFMHIGRRGQGRYRHAAVGPQTNESRSPAPKLTSTLCAGLLVNAQK